MIPVKPFFKTRPKSVTEAKKHHTKEGAYAQSIGYELVWICSQQGYAESVEYLGILQIRVSLGDVVCISSLLYGLVVYIRF